MRGNEVTATYLIETPYPLERAAAIMAGEQSTGTFIAVPGETDELKELHAAKVLAIEPIEESITPTLPGVYLTKEMNNPVYRRAIVKISFPFHNFGLSLPNLLSTIAGNLYELREFSGLRLLDIELPSEFATQYPGPKFGIAGTRELAGVHGRPLIGTIIKPSIGLPLDDYGPLVRMLAEAGLDFIKDDELCGNPPYAPFEQRVKTVMTEIERVADRTGKKLMYAFNITGDIDEMKRNHDIVYEAGGTCVMVCVNSVGLAGVSHLRGYTELPVHGHRTQWGAMSRCPLLGMSFTAYQKLCRLAGVDHLHTNGLNSKFAESNDSVSQSIRDCLQPMFGGYEAMPVLSSAQWAGSAIPTYQSVGTLDVIHLAGGGILAHPDGVAAGVRSMQLGWEAAVQGVELEKFAESHPELQAAIRVFGG
ncbi:ribulose-bisphosphate carboxylase large subunit family protein [Paenibacillus sp. J5C_2022]|uniref:ribulose-bisphosphate carboxylase large subunit family protein n=1 Tax=Paenibacillus sp. J5C2022 TaxID=2977129 RepID=UPI0021CEA602|nr:ribulose-bisphosphate carboxylase large subunit family protein [Paenibacillus sp. J5C2022]MCU6707924.1 ribulose-bisphosphate carboxylase large subunit family protein [Paenibacillus sp. J5C2022]